MTKDKIFPTILIICNVLASIGCLACKDYKKAVYWMAAAVLNASVTF